MARQSLYANTLYLCWPYACMTANCHIHWTKTSLCLVHWIMTCWCFMLCCKRRRDIAVYFCRNVCCSLFWSCDVISVVLLSQSLSFLLPLFNIKSGALIDSFRVFILLCGHLRCEIEVDIYLNYTMQYITTLQSM